MGAGKTAVLAEASDTLSRRQIIHAAIDLDALGTAYLPSAAPSDGVMYDNLRSIFRNYAALGVRRFILARALEEGTQLRLCREIIPAVNPVVCRLTAKPRNDAAPCTDAGARDIAVRIGRSGCGIECHPRPRALGGFLRRQRESLVDRRRARNAGQGAMDPRLTTGWNSPVRPRILPGVSQEDHAASYTVLRNCGGLGTRPAGHAELLP